MPTSANNTQKRTPHSRRNATPAEIRHAQGGLITAAELHLFDELLPEFSSGSDKVDFLGLMNKWNSERATTTQQLQVTWSQHCAGLHPASGLCHVLSQASSMHCLL